MEVHSVGQSALGRCKKRRSHHRVPGMRARLRIVSNIGLILGQCILLFASREVGLIVIISSSVLSFPYFLHEKMWDVIVLMIFMSTINIIGLFVQ